MKKKYKATRYTVYDNKTDFPIIVCGTAAECASIMGITINAFFINKKGGTRASRRWIIITERECGF